MSTKQRNIHKKPQNNHPDRLSTGSKASELSLTSLLINGAYADVLCHFIPSPSRGSSRKQTSLHLHQTVLRNLPYFEGIFTPPDLKTIESAQSKNLMSSLVEVKANPTLHVQQITIRIPFSFTTHHIAYFLQFVYSCVDKCIDWLERKATASDLITMVKLCRFFGLPRDTVLWEIFDRLLSKWYFLACDFEFHFELTMNLVSSLPRNWYKWYNFSTEYALIMLNSTIIDSLLKLMMHRSLKERYKEWAADCGSALDYEDLKVGEPVDYEYSEFYDGVSDTTDESASDTSTVCSTTSSSTSSSSASQSSAEHIISYDPTENRSSSPDSSGDSEETLVDSDGQDIKMKGGSEGESPFDPYDVPDLCIHLLEFFEDAKLKPKHKNSIILNLEPIWESLCQKAGPSELRDFVSLLLESDLKGKVIKVLTKIANHRIGLLLQPS